MTVLADNIRRAAHGRHRCGWCQRPIPAGQQYRDVRQAQDGTVWTWREHLACGAFMLRHADPFDWPIEYPIETYQEMVEEHGDPLAVIEPAFDTCPCPACTGERCWLCEAMDGQCDHDVIDRHAGESCLDPESEAEHSEGDA